MKTPAGAKLREGAITDYTLSQLQDAVAKMKEAIRMLEMDVEALEARLAGAKETLGLPIGSYNVRGPADFFEE